MAPPGINDQQVTSRCVVQAGVVAALVATTLLASSSTAQDPPRDQAHRYRYLYRIAQAQRELASGRMERAEQVLEACPETLRHWEWRYLKQLCRPRARRVVTVSCYDSALRLRTRFGWHGPRQVLARNARE